MDKNFWLKAWEDNNIAFHETQVNDYLTRFFAKLQPVTEAILVPLCGRSVDLLWLLKHHSKVVGVELSKIAVESFWRERGITPELEQRGVYTVYSFEQCKILLGDFFKLRTSDIGKVSAVYDKGCLVALPPELRIKYVDLMKNLLCKGTKMLLIAVEYDKVVVTPPFPVTQTDITQLYGDAFSITLLAKEKMKNIAPSWEEKGVDELTRCIYFLEKTC